MRHAKMWSAVSVVAAVVVWRAYVGTQDAERATNPGQLEVKSSPAQEPPSAIPSATSKPNERKADDVHANVPPVPLEVQAANLAALAPHGNRYRRLGAGGKPPESTGVVLSVQPRARPATGK